ncbi:3-hydroxyacyl-CoA dehydrogenase NAD-binding domain-containing protein [Microvirga sp. 17 mud 1-3]|uniref:3-hydroxyacyl-CoA dehydrogenase NAD-binding domain-containing protein n=1 Tax=Microvirga sp. 17 mud 1-3 TaxID=2082949 RepID=UPI002110B04E|nr:3-hydroxyacyl-CoA dehydrogenase NAD-binding domain-containing protein [Microvirga sp. 17 mud 1-3]
MTFDPSRPDLTIGIVGAGIMGRGIAQVAAEAGIRVLIADMRPEAITEARNFCADMIRRKAAKGALTPRLLRLLLRGSAGRAPAPRSPTRILPTAAW